MSNFRFRAIIDIDVQNADTESSAREKAFAIMSAANAQPSRGRTPSGPKASVTGITIQDCQAQDRVLVTTIHSDSEVDVTE